MAVASALPAPAGKELACKSAVAISFEFQAESLLVTLCTREVDSSKASHSPCLWKSRCRARRLGILQRQGSSRLELGKVQKLALECSHRLGLTDFRANCG